VRSEVVNKPPKKMGWTCSERRGWEVKIIPDDFSDRFSEFDSDKEKLAYIAGLENLKELNDGTKVFAMGILGWVPGVIVVSGAGDFSSACVESGGSIFPLERADDDRDCFVTLSQINKEAIRSIRLEGEGR